ncbi:MAG: transposase [Candidatus Portnoybacteria bacterium]|nr:transposase [Candidatus Portnoybacteria bacterium]
MATSTYPHGSLPVKVSRRDFNRYVNPYLSRGKRGPPTKISRHKIFNYILYVLHTGMQWDELRPKRNEIHWSNVYRWHNKWSKDGSYQNLFESGIERLRLAGKLDLSVIHGDGSNPVAKKGVRISATPVTNIRKD